MLKFQDLTAHPCSQSLSAKKKYNLLDVIHTHNTQLVKLIFKIILCKCQKKNKWRHTCNQ